MKRWLAALLLLGCAHRPTVRDRICENTHHVWMDPLFQMNERAAIVRAELAWTRATRDRECFVEVPYDDATLKIFRAQERKELLIRRQWNGWEHTVGMWFPNLREIWLVVESYNDTDLTTIMAHEIGHSFGLSHADAPKGASVINADLDDDFPMVPSAEIPAIDVRRYCVVNGCP